jgi:hypothetical protein
MVGFMYGWRREELLGDLERDNLDDQFDRGEAQCWDNISTAILHRVVVENIHRHSKRVKIR